MSPHDQIRSPSAALTHTDHREAVLEMPESSDWMDIDNAATRRWHFGAPLVRPSRSGQLCRLRQQFRREANERHARGAGDRQLRLLAYSLVLGAGASPDEDWNTLQAEAEQHGYAIGARLHDVAVPAATGYFPGTRDSRGVYTPPWKRPGWGEVERLIRGGFATGVIVLDRHNISSDDDEYHAVIRQLGERYQAFIHLVIPEEPAVPT
ncbi:hypothetical protein [Streptomyces sp. SPB162]|uniref:hypothetical protein n=1 Tax=Streptomyces sp. SPB162 TaxID=2940560 RepID=UPI0024076ADF|nr:hypothetical protein [Streptomyces sp. SPB162]MDF9814048.1 hypothetical protein [Streptomyces sp. SPB162]